MAASHTPRPAALAPLLGLAGALVAAILGLLTFGAQATARPDHLPLAVVIPYDPAPQLNILADRISHQGGDAVSWRVTTPDKAKDLLERKEIYGFLDLTGTPAATIEVSGATHPQGAQFAQLILTDVAHQLAKATPGAPTVEAVAIHPAGLAARTAPLAASALLWICGLVATLGFGLLTLRRGVWVGVGPRAIVGATASILGVGVIAGLFTLWDNSLPLNWKVLGWLLLTAVAFASVQGALLRHLKLRAAAILGPLYLIAPAVAGQAPEMLNPTYRALLWSWTPFRFSTEGLRSLLQGTPDATDVRTGLIVLSAMAVAGLVIMLWPPRRSTRQKAQANPANGVVDIRVDKADGLPGAERELPVEHRNGGVRR
jgi:hypothetical protein